MLEATFNVGLIHCWEPKRNIADISATGTIWEARLKTLRLVIRLTRLLGRRLAGYPMSELTRLHQLYFSRQTMR